MTPVPVLLAAQMIEGGGSERQMTELAKSLDRNRFTPHVACCISDAAKAAELRGLGIPVLEIPLRSFIKPGAVVCALQLRRYLCEQRIGIFHAFDMPMSWFGVAVAKFAGTKTVLASQRGHRLLYPKKYQRLMRFSDKIADGVVVNAESLRRHLIEDEHVPPQKIHLCHNGIDTARFRPLDRDTRRPLTIGTVCVLRPEKGLPALLLAFAQMQQPGLRLLIAGSGSELAGLQAQARSLGIDGQTEFRPATRNVPGMLAEIDIFVLPSLSEGFSNSLMEAMACRCAVVASAVGGNIELVTPNQTGLLFESGNVSELCAALSQLADDRVERERLATEASKYIHRRFSQEASAHTMGQIYETISASRSQS